MDPTDFVEDRNNSEWVEWSKLWDPASSSFYYYSNFTGECLWEAPEAWSEQQQPSGDLKDDDDSDHNRNKNSKSIYPPRLRAVLKIQGAFRARQSRRKVRLQRAIVATKDQGTAADSNSWVPVTDPTSGATYYYHPATGECSWEQKDTGGATDETKQEMTTKEATAQLFEKGKENKNDTTEQNEANILPTWVHLYDPRSESMYYYNNQTQETSWETPVDFEAADNTRPAKLLMSAELLGALKLQNAFRSRAARKTTRSQRAKVAATKHDASIKGEWVEVYDPACKATYYYNQSTHECVWDIPESFTSREAQTMKDKAAENNGEEEEKKEENYSDPPNEEKLEEDSVQVVGVAWEVGFDPNTSQPYFRNKITGECVWERPADVQDFDFATQEKSEEMQAAEKMQSMFRSTHARKKNQTRMDLLKESTVKPYVVKIHVKNGKGLPRQTKQIIASLKCGDVQLRQNAPRGKHSYNSMGKDPTWHDLKVSFGTKEKGVGSADTVKLTLHSAKGREIGASRIPLEPIFLRLLDPAARAQGLLDDSIITEDWYELTLQTEYSSKLVTEKSKKKKKKKRHPVVSKVGQIRVHVSLGLAHTADLTWLELFDSSEQRFYYFNKETNVSQWQKPNDFVAGAEDDVVVAAISIQCAFRRKRAKRLVTRKRMQGKWVRGFDPNTSKIYYLNVSDRQTQWAEPEGFCEGGVDVKMEGATTIQCVFRKRKAHKLVALKRLKHVKAAVQMASQVARLAFVQASIALDRERVLSAHGLLQLLAKDVALHETTPEATRTLVKFVHDAVDEALSSLDACDKDLNDACLCVQRGQGDGSAEPVVRNMLVSAESAADSCGSLLRVIIDAVRNELEYIKEQPICRAAMVNKRAFPTYRKIADVRLIRGAINDAEMLLDRVAEDYKKFSGLAVRPVDSRFGGAMMLSRDGSSSNHNNKKNKNMNGNINNNNTNRQQQQQYQERSRRTSTARRGTTSRGRGDHSGGGGVKALDIQQEWEEQARNESTSNWVAMVPPNLKTMMDEGAYFIIYMRRSAMENETQGSTSMWERSEQATRLKNGDELWVRPESVLKPLVEARLAQEHKCDAWALPQLLTTYRTSRDLSLRIQRLIESERLRRGQDREAILMTKEDAMNKVFYRQEKRTALEAKTKAEFHEMCRRKWTQGYEAKTEAEEDERAERERVAREMQKRNNDKILHRRQTRKLLDSKRDQDVFSPWEACRAGSSLMCFIRLLKEERDRRRFQEGRDLFVYDTDPDTGETLLHTAAWFGCSSILGYLLEEEELDANRQSGAMDRSTPLHCAVRGGNVEAAMVLLENDAALDAQDSAGETPMHWASRLGSVLLVKQLLASKGAKQQNNPPKSVVKFVNGKGSSNALWNMVATRNRRGRLASQVAKSLPAVKQILQTYELKCGALTQEEIARLENEAEYKKLCDDDRNNNNRNRNNNNNNRGGKGKYAKRGNKAGMMNLKGGGDTDGLSRAEVILRHHTMMKEKEKEDSLLMSHTNKRTGKSVYMQPGETRVDRRKAPRTKKGGKGSREEMEKRKKQILQDTEQEVRDGKKREKSNTIYNNNNIKQLIVNAPPAVGFGSGGGGGGVARTTATAGGGGTITTSAGGGMVMVYESSSQSNASMVGGNSTSTLSAGTTMKDE